MIICSQERNGTRCVFFIDSSSDAMNTHILSKKLSTNAIKISFSHDLKGYLV
ncbi:hypothetical protein KDI_24730 [Dictyobacter arantiisoli]|uniref:Uncharacterized protein n=1 Tax=Dictyobacter arantiisoli TaxID=2014874 RepID=A0A5A5TD13_9CHLR|nr:hypothetical protein KDI_24730 [Dictyobacter arantiisoli]